MKLTYQQKAKERLDKFLHEQIPDQSRSKLQKIIRDGLVTVNGKPALVHRWLKQGDTIEIHEATDEADQKKTEKIPKPSVIHQTDDFAVILKPAGMLIHPTEQREKGTLTDWLVQKFPTVASVGDDPLRPGLVHRLDRDVGGLLLAALNQPTFEYLKSLFQRREITKRYQCLVHGIVPSNEGFIAVPIAKNKKTGRMVAQSSTMQGKEALTRFRVIKRFNNFTLLDIALVTGRTHQIRTHLYSIGHSIVGDRLYRTRNIKKQRQKQMVDHPFLFAYYLSFIDRDGVRREFKIPFPDDFAAILKAMR